MTISKQKAILILIILAIILVAIALFILSKPALRKELSQISNSFTKSTNSSTPSIKAEYLNRTGSNDCENIIDEAKRNACFLELNDAMNDPSAKACDKLSSEQNKAVCQQAQFTKEVSESGDLKKCDLISNETNKLICVSQASLNLALTTRDAKYCDKMAFPDDQASCKRTVEQLIKK